MNKDNSDNRPLEVVELEFGNALEIKDKESILDILNERKDLVVFFCALATIKKEKMILREVGSEMNESDMKNVIMRMTTAPSARVGSVSGNVIESE